MKSYLLALICIAVLCITLSLGLWPFHAPSNEVSWLRDRNGVRFGAYGTAFSSRSLPSTTSQDSLEASVEIWLVPRRLRASGTFLAFYPLEKRQAQFSIRQSQKDLWLQAETQSDQSPPKRVGFYVDDLFGDLRPVFITVTSGQQGTRVYLDGVLVRQAPHFPLSIKAFAGRLIIGDSPGQSDSWSGELLGLAIYHRDLTQPQVVHHYEGWKQNGRPEIAEDEHNLALYLLDERSGNTVRDRSGSGMDLYIPQKYLVLNQIFLEPIWSEFNLNRGYWISVLKNIVGFVPFGFCFYAYMATVLNLKRATLFTVALGTAVSLTIEILQGYLPTRDSGTTDIITNTLGTWIGVASYGLLTPTVTRFFPWSPFPPLPR